jgi:hypothetical protein
MINIFDGYEIRARIFPAILVTSPLVFPAIPIIKAMGLMVGETIYIVIIYLSIIYLLSMLLRYKGKKFEAEFWKDWGGAPSSLIMTENDNNLGDITRNVIRRKIKEKLEIEIVPNAPDEEKKINEAFKLIKALYNNETGLIYKHNYEYGFLRNLYGGYNLWTVISILSIALSGFQVYYLYSTLCLFSLIIGIIFLIIILSISRRGLKRKIKKAAFTHASTLWTTYYHRKDSQD